MKKFFIQFLSETIKERQYFRGAALITLCTVKTHSIAADDADTAYTRIATLYRNLTVRFLL